MKHYENFVFKLFCLITALMLPCGAEAAKSRNKPSAGLVKRPSQVHQTWFDGTSYKLDVHRIYGRTPGATMLIVGGIQGNEPGGFLSADLYVDMHLYKGDLIVVPRANFKSVILYRRGPDGDMNRQFHREHNGRLKPSMKGVVQVIQKLMKDSDVFLNLHDGWGFHSPTYVNKLRNPHKFGQSIVIDTASYNCSGQGKTINLAAIARRAISEVNRRITQPRHRMAVFDTKTNTGRTHLSSEMRKTATWYALTKHCIPAFGIESSKNLKSTELKVLYHNYAINAFMAQYDIIPEYPPLLQPKPSLIYALATINGDAKIIHRNVDHLALNPGDSFNIKHLEANYKRGLSCDILGVGHVNDLGREYSITRDTKVIFRKDQRIIGTLNITVLADKKRGRKIPRVEPQQPQPAGWVLTYKKNGSKRELTAGETAYVRKRDVVVLKNAWSSRNDGADVEVNFKGFVPNMRNNKGDDRNHPIVFGRTKMLRKYSVNRRGRLWRIEATINDKPAAEFFMMIVK